MSIDTVANCTYPCTYPCDIPNDFLFVMGIFTGMAIVIIWRRI